MEKEIWKDVPGYEGLYQVSSIGNVRSLNYRGLGKVATLKPAPDKKGYLHVNLSKDGKNTTCQIHRLVAVAFIPNPDELPVVNHKDWNVANNQVGNLEWCTARYNSQYRKNTGYHLPNERVEIFNRYVKEHNIKKKIANAEDYRKRKLRKTD